LEKEYSSNVSHQDGDLPHRMQITYKEGGASYYVNDYFPHLHYQASATLADQDYDELINWSNEEQTWLEDLEVESEPIQELVDEGAADGIEKLSLLSGGK
jgi:hypothetical protein